MYSFMDRGLPIITMLYSYVRKGFLFSYLSGTVFVRMQFANFRSNVTHQNDKLE